MVDHFYIRLECKEENTKCLLTQKPVDSKIYAFLLRFCCLIDKNEIYMMSSNKRVTTISMKSLYLLHKIMYKWAKMTPQTAVFEKKIILISLAKRCQSV